MTAGPPKVVSDNASAPSAETRRQAPHVRYDRRDGHNMHRSHAITRKATITLTALAAALLVSFSFVGIAAAEDTAEPASAGLVERDTRIATVEATSQPLASALTRRVVRKPFPKKPAVVRASATRVKVTSATPSRTSELSRAKAILRRHIAKRPILRGTTVTIGKTPNGAQAVAYYTVGRIVINPKHKASLERILAHEVWHIIDWRDNGRIDWGERVPPKR